MTVFIIMTNIFGGVNSDKACFKRVKVHFSNINLDHVYITFVIECSYNYTNFHFHFKTSAFLCACVCQLAHAIALSRIRLEPYCVNVTRDIRSVGIKHHKK